jgi:hypothetical protein
MRRRIAVMVVMLSSLYYTSNSSAQMSHEEEVVRNAYAKLSFMCELVFVDAAALDINGNGTDGPRRSNVDALHTLIAEFCPFFSLSAFQTGPIADIANEPLSRFITLSTPHDEVIRATKRGMSYNFFGNETGWISVEFKWVDITQSGSNGYPYPEDFTVAKGMAQKEFQWSDQKNPVFTRYAAYTVNATLQGKSTAPHRAVFFFGHDTSGKEVITPEDPLDDTSILYRIQDELAYPGAFLSSDVRDVPVVAAWVRSHEMPSASCSEVARTLCCSQGHCGISQSDINRELAAPLPPAKNGAGQ